ncbi:MAG: DUF4864 domain-containing protein [Armatimonadetes bacterium]|nr:DUF4864 domain-containing protein [Armatimonadota bacterium]
MPARSVTLLSIAIWCVVTVLGAAAMRAEGVAARRATAAAQSDKNTPQSERQAPEGPENSTRPAPRPTFTRVATEEEKKAATGAIEAQLTAFRNNDYDKAIQFQSNTLRRNFDSVRQFREMIQQSYPQFARCRRVEFGATRSTEDGGALEVRAVVTGQDDRVVRATYVMVREGMEYRVQGVEGGRPFTVNTRDIL